MFATGIIFICIAVGIAAHYGLLGFPSRGEQIKLVIDGHAFSVEVRDTPAGRAQGLSGKDSLGENEGMLFKFNTPGDYGFWMKDMKFPIDMVWIVGGKVVDVTKNAVPEPQKSMFSLTVYHPPVAVDTILEINAGEAERYGIKAGSIVEMQ